MYTVRNKMAIIFAFVNPLKCNEMIVSWKYHVASWLPCSCWLFAILTYLVARELLGGCSAIG